MTRTILTAAAFLLTAGAAAAGGPACEPITIEKFAALKMGSSYAEAVEVLGCEGEEISRVEMQVPEFPGLQMKTVSSVMYVWRNPDLSSVSAMFHNDRLISRSQFGLTSPAQKAAAAADRAAAEAAREKLCQRAPLACR
jgi:hypothetical protein